MLIFDKFKRPLTFSLGDEDVGVELPHLVARLLRFLQRFQPVLARAVAVVDLQVAPADLVTEPGGLQRRAGQ